MGRAGKADGLGMFLVPLGGMTLSAITGLTAGSIEYWFLSVLGFSLSLDLMILLVVGRSEWLQSVRLRKSDVERVVDQLFLVASQRFALAIEPARPAGGRRLRGCLDGSDIVVTCIPGSDSVQTWTTSVSVQLRHPRLAEIEIRSRWKASTSMLGGETPAMALVETGSAEIDKLLEVRGRGPMALALLTAPVRAALTSLGRRGVVVLSRGSLTFEINDFPGGLGELQSLVDSTIAVAKTIDEVVVDDVAMAVAETASQDPEPGVRAQALRTLVAELGDHPATGPALQRALSDRSDAVRVIAASALGEQGLPALQEIATTQGSDESAAARAINILGRRLTTENLLAILDSALHTGRSMVAEAAVTALGRPGDVAACARLAEILREADGPLAVAAATALARSAVPEAERSLIAALGSTWAGVRYAAACALEDVGGPEALVALHALLGPEHDPTDVETRRAAQRAIARIRERVPDLAPGHVSLAAPEGGDLCVSDAPGQGRVSLLDGEVR